MTRGKYGAKAAKRQETQALEAEVTKLRHALARAEQERDETKESLEKLRVVSAAERRVLLADAEAGASPSLHRLRDELAAEREARARDRVELAEQVFQVMEQYATKMKEGGYEKIASLFGQGHRMGELIMGDESAPRRARRATARTTRILGDMKMAPEWAKASARAASKWDGPL